MTGSNPSPLRTPKASRPLSYPAAGKASPPCDPTHLQPFCRLRRLRSTDLKRRCKAIVKVSTCCRGHTLTQPSHRGFGAPVRQRSALAPHATCNQRLLCKPVLKLDRCIVSLRLRCSIKHRSGRSLRGGSHEPRPRQDCCYRLGRDGTERLEVAD